MFSGNATVYRDFDADLRSWHRGETKPTGRNWVPALAATGNVAKWCDSTVDV